jgi:hypothetical protein
MSRIRMGLTLATLMLCLAAVEITRAITLPTALR